MNDISPPAISVVIPHRNDWAHLACCIAALVEQRPRSPAFEIIVVDNGSTDRAAEEAFLAAFGDRVVYLREPRAGAALARNRGAAAARAPLLLFIDSDCRPGDDWVAALASCVEAHGCCGGDVQVALPDSRLSAAEAFERIFAFRQEMYIKRKGFSGAGNLGVRREIFDNVGPFRAEVSEDTDWGLRAGAKGYTITYCPQAKVWHPARPTLAALKAKWRRMCREEVALRRQNGQGSLWLLYKVVAVAASPLVHAFVCLGFRDFRLETRLKAVGALFLIRWYRVWRYLAEWKWRSVPAVGDG